MPPNYDEEPLSPEGAFTPPDLDQEQRLGHACRMLLDSEGYRLATGAMQDAIWDAFRVTPVRDTEGLTYLRLLQQAVQDMHKLLEDAADTGRLAAAELTRLREEAQSVAGQTDRGR